MLYVVLIIVIFLLDDKIKNYIENKKDFHKKEEILKGAIIIERYHNKGAMLNFMEKHPKWIRNSSLTILGGLFAFFIHVLTRKGEGVLKFALSLVFGGALSNTYDRLKKGYVVDYFSFCFLKKIVFNISDICIFLGSFVFCIYSIFKKN